MGTVGTQWDLAGDLEQLWGLRLNAGIVEFLWGLGKGHKKSPEGLLSELFEI